MKFRDPKTGEVFEDIQQAHEKFCPNTLCKDKPYEVLAKNCALCRINMRSNGWYELCDSFCDDHPAEAAHLMGYEVIEDEPYDSSGTCGTCEDFTPLDSAEYGRCERSGKILPSEHKCEQKEDNMDKQDKPRLAEVLGVSTGSSFDLKIGESSYGPYKLNETGNDIFHIQTESSICIEHLIYAINHPESIIRAPRLTEAELERCRVYGAKWVSKDPCSTITVELWEEKPRLDSGVYISNTKEYLVRAKDRFFPSVRPGDLINVEEAQT